jgi:DNA repair protein RadA
MLASDIAIKDIEGIGPTTARKLSAAGISTVYDLATHTAVELSEKVKCSRDAAAKYITAAQKLMRENNLIDQEFMSASEAEGKRKEVLRLSTGSAALDKFFLGGIETKAVTEFFGEFGSGKSQLCHTVSAIACQPVEKGGLGGGVIYLDTEGTFRPERLRRIAELRGLDAEQVMSMVKSAKAYGSSHLEVLIGDLGKYVEQFNAKLVIVDSVTNLHRAEYIGRGNLAERQGKLATIMHKLLRTAEIYNIAVIITNQVHHSPDSMFGDPTKPAGGNIVGHASTYRIYLRKAGADRIARMVDSPSHPYTEQRFTVDESGVRDIEEEESKK